MFGMGGTEILVILIVALLFLGPDKLPDAAKQISKGIRDLKKQTRVLQQTIENDEHIGGAIRDLKSALRGDEPAPRPRSAKDPEAAVAAAATGALAAGEATSEGGDADQAAGAPGDAAADPATTADGATAEGASESADAGAEAGPAVRLPATAGEPDPDVPEPDVAEDEELAALIKPAAGTVAQGGPRAASEAPDGTKHEHG